MAWAGLFLIVTLLTKIDQNCTLVDVGAIATKKHGMEQKQNSSNNQLGGGCRTKSFLQSHFPRYGGV
jgi:hypothetical protein